MNTTINFTSEVLADLRLEPEQHHAIQCNEK